MLQWQTGENEQKIGGTTYASLVLHLTAPNVPWDGCLQHFVFRKLSSMVFKGAFLTKKHWQQHYSCIRYLRTGICNDDDVDDKQYRNLSCK